MKQIMRKIWKDIFETFSGMLLIIIILALAFVAYKFIGMVPPKFLENNWKGIIIGILFTIISRFIGEIWRANKQKNKKTKTS